MKYFKKLVGERIYLSPRNNQDIEKFVEWLNDFETTDYLDRSSDLITIEGEKKYLEEVADGYFFVIVDLENDKMIGTISLERVCNANRSAVLGIFIGDKDYRSKGYGTEAIRLLLDFGFNYLNLHSVNLNVMSFNDRAIACYKKCGFREAGRRRECVYVNGKYYDKISMDILKDEFSGSYIKNKNV